MKKILPLLSVALLAGTSFSSVSANNSANLYYLTFMIQDGNRVIAMPNLAVEEGNVATVETNTSFGTIKMHAVPQSANDKVDVNWNMTLTDITSENKHDAATTVRVGYNEALNITAMTSEKAKKPFSDVSVTMQVTSTPN